MPLPQCRWLHHTPPGWVGDATYFLTLCCQTRSENQLCTGDAPRVLLAAVEHYHLTLRWHVTLWLLMPDHLHALVSLPRVENLTPTMAAWKRYTALSTGIKWQRGFFDHRLRSDESLQEKADYIRMNPLRKGLVAHPKEWPHLWVPPER